MTSSGSDWTLDGLQNPLKVQSDVLKRFENDTGVAIVDSNNPASVLMEMFASLSSGYIKMLDDTVRPAIYPARAVTAGDLFKHISDYDYVRMFSSPASTYVLLIVDKHYLMTNAVPVQKTDDNDNLVTDNDGNPVYLPYKKVVIPATTRFVVGEYTFGLYYPIEIKTNSSTGRFTVTYDTTQDNPMKSLETNSLEYDFHEFNGHHLAYIHIPVYQFDTVSHDIVLVSGSGYKQTLNYDNKFYALRCYADVLINEGHDESETDIFERRELSLAVSGQVYDPKTPTVIFTPNVENNTVDLEIPYVYFTEGKIKGTLHVDLYTTHGALNYKIPNDSVENCTIDMFTNTTDSTALMYAQPFRTMPGLDIVPWSMSIIGGSDGMTFENMRNLVIHGVNTRVLQTPSDVASYFAANGYTASLLRDGITDRIFTVHAPVKDSNGMIVGCDTIGTQFDFSNIDEISTIVQDEAGSTFYTILPSTLYKFDKERQICIPLTDIERINLDGLSPAGVVSAFNNEVYTLSPFHLQINAAKRYPTTITYDMLDKSIQSRVFVGYRDNVAIGLNLSTVNFDVVKDANGLKDNYRLTFRVGRTELNDLLAMTSDIQDTTIGDGRNIRVLVGLKNDDGSFYYGEAAWQKREEDLDVFELLVTPSYVFKQANNEHTVQMGFWGSEATKDPICSDFKLTCEARVMLLLDRAAYEIHSQETFSGNVYLETDYTSSSFVNASGQSEPSIGDYITMSEHKIVLQFGSVVDEMDQRINLTYSETQYKRHLTTKFRTLEDDKYATVKGNLDYKIIDGKVVLTVLYPKGTLTCLTSLGDDTQTLNEYTKTNYIGCTAIKDDTKTVITSENVDGLVSSHEPVSMENVPAFPRFSIEKINESYDYLTGSYELIDRKDEKGFSTVKPLSSIHDVWAKTGNNDIVKKDERTTRNMTIRTINSFLYVLKNLIPESHIVESEEDDQDPLNNIEDLKQFSVGSFVVVWNDYSTPSFIKLGWIGEESETKLTNWARVYFKYRTPVDQESDAWLCLCEGLDLASIISGVKKENDDAMSPKYFGFAYALTVETGSKSSVPYIAFLTKEEFNGVLIPEFSSRALIAWEERTPENVEVIDPDWGWEQHANRWPWDVKDWWTVSQDAAIALDTEFTSEFDHKRLNRFCEYTTAQIIMNNDGLPIEDPEQPRTIQYLVDMLQLDAKHLKVTANNDDAGGCVYPGNVVEVLRTHFDNVSTAKETMFTNTRLFFEPIKSLGYATFEVGNNMTEDLPLDIKMKFKMHVTQSAYEDDITLDTLRSQVIEIIDSQIDSGYVSCTEIASTIISKLSDTVKFVDILGINDRNELQTMKCSDTNVCAHLRHELKLLDDGVTIDLTRGVDIEFVVNN